MGVQECQQSLHALYYVLDTLVRLMSPLTPFLCEHMYMNLRRLLPVDQREGSVHFTMMPEAKYVL